MIQQEITHVMVRLVKRVLYNIHIISQNRSRNLYSRTSGKRPPKLSSLGSCLWEVVACESSHHVGSSKFCLMSIRWLKSLLPVLNALFTWKSILRKSSALPFKKFPSLLLSRNAIMLQYIIIQFSFNCMSTGRLRDVKNKRKFQIFTSESARGGLREVVAYKRVWNIVIWLGNFWYFGKLVAEERWSQPKDRLYLILFLFHRIDRFYVVVALFSNRSQKTSKCLEI